MKPMRIVQLVLVFIAIVALLVVYFQFRDHFWWLLIGFLLGVLVGAVPTFMVMRNKKTPEAKPAQP